MADIATTGRFCYLGNRPAEPVLCTYDDNGYHMATDAEIFAKAHALLKVRFRRGPGQQLGLVASPPLTGALSHRLTSPWRHLRTTVKFT